MIDVGDYSLRVRRRKFLQNDDEIRNFGLLTARLDKGELENVEVLLFGHERAESFA